MQEVAKLKKGQTGIIGEIDHYRSPAYFHFRNEANKYMLALYHPATELLLGDKGAILEQPLRGLPFKEKD